MLRILKFVVLFAGILFSQNNNSINQVRANLKSVKIYINNAELNHSLETELTKGYQTLIIENISSGIVENSIRTKFENSVKILSVKKRNDFIGEIKKSSEWLKLEDDLKKLEKDRQALNIKMDVLRAQENLITSMNKSVNEVNTVKIDNLLLYYSQKLPAIYNERANLSLTINEKNQEIDKVVKQLNEYKSANNSPKKTIEIYLFSERTGKFSGELSYLTNNAGWLPTYNVYVDKIGEPAKINLNASVHQNTGLEWKNTELFISTYSPAYADKPELEPWYLYFEMPQMAPAAMYLKKENVRVVNEEMAAGNATAEYDVAAPETIEFQTSFAYEFNPKINIVIPSDGKNYTIPLKEQSLNAEFEYYAAPRISNSVHLISRFINWRNIFFLPGEASVFFENSFTNNIYINPETDRDTLELSLGIDKAIFVERKSLSEFTETKFLSNNIERFFDYEILIKNNKKENINIKIQENYPVSQHENIIVELIDIQNALNDKSRGILTWTGVIKPASPHKIHIKYSVKYPGDKNINLN